MSWNFSYRSKATCLFLWVAALLLFSPLSQAEITAPGSRPQGTNKGGYKNLTVVDHARLEVYSENSWDRSSDIAGVVLACEQSQNDSIGFCQGSCSENVGNTQK